MAAEEAFGSVRRDEKLLMGSSTRHKVAGEDVDRCDGRLERCWVDLDCGSHD